MQWNRLPNEFQHPSVILTSPEMCRAAQTPIKLALCLPASSSQGSWRKRSAQAVIRRFFFQRAFVRASGWSTVSPRRRSKKKKGTSFLYQPLGLFFVVLQSSSLHRNMIADLFWVIVNKFSLRLSYFAADPSCSRPIYACFSVDSVSSLAKMFSSANATETSCHMFVIRDWHLPTPKKEKRISRSRISNFAHSKVLGKTRNGTQQHHIWQSWVWSTYHTPPGRVWLGSHDPFSSRSDSTSPWWQLRDMSE